MKTIKLLFMSMILPCFVLQAEVTVIYNVKGNTINDGSRISFQAIAFNDGKVLAIGKDEEILSAYPNADKMDAKGQAMLPGLHDAHGHVMRISRLQSQVNLMGVDSLKGALDEIKQFADAHPETEWITGRGWNQVLWEGKQFPTKTDLDNLKIDKPIWLERVDGHAGWANSKAMKIAKTSTYEKGIEGGEIIEDQFGIQTGVFIDNAMHILEDEIPQEKAINTVALMSKGLEYLSSLGLTSVDDAGIDWPTYQSYNYLANLNELPMRVNAMVHSGDDNFKKMIALGPVHSSDDYLQIHAVKYVYDGALGSRGAAMIEDYSDRHNHKGLFVQTDEFITENILNLASGGWQAGIHAIGDQANRLAINLLANPKAQTKSNRNRIEHLQIVNIDDIKKVAQYNIIASMQPTHATSDMNMAEDRVGKARLQGAYAWQTLINDGVVIASGSDFPVELANPFFGLHAAVTRQDRNNQPLKGWIPEQAMTVEQALASFTINAAYTNRKAQVLGSLEPGKWADFILVDQDIFSIDAKDIWKTEVQETWIAGQKAYDKEDS
ncbi:MAG: amidohydrolase [Marinicellaceae bacterium]